METGSRTTRDQRGGMRDDNTGTGGQWDNPMSKGGQGKWEHREGDAVAGGRLPLRGWSLASGPMASRSSGLLLIILSLDTTGGRGGDTYTSQQLGQSGYEQGTNTGQTGTDIQSDRYATSGQFGGTTGTTGQTTGHADPATRVIPEDDDEYGASVGPGGGPTGKPSMTSRVKGTAEKMTGKMMGDPGKQARGREREEGNF